MRESHTTSQLRADWKGITIAAVILVAWASHLVLWLSVDLSSVPLWAIPAGVLLQAFLHTGLFITAHDAMHGTVAPGRRRLNDAIGTLATTLYALFSYRKLHEKHHEHHAHPVSDEDPDFHGRSHHDPQDDNDATDRFWPWYGGFLLEYVGLWQIVGMAVVFNLLHHALGVGLWNLNMLWVLPSLLSTLQLFYFGTYLPHRRPEGGFEDAHHATTNEFAPWLSFLTCYHFGYHWEHHEYPHVPWWKLPNCRKS